MLVKLIGQLVEAVKIKRLCPMNRNPVCDGCVEIPVRNRNFIAVRLFQSYIIEGSRFILHKQLTV